MFGVKWLELEYNGNKLIIKRSTKAQLISITYLMCINIVFIIAGIYFTKSSENPGSMYLFWFIVAACIFQLFKPIRELISNEYFVFDQTSKRIYKKDVVKATFDQVDYLEIEVISGGDSSDSYKLILRLNNKPSIQIEQSTKAEEIRRVAGEIATFIDVKVKGT